MRAIDGDALAELLSGVRRRLDPKAYKTATEFYTRDEMLLNLEQITRTAPTIDPVKHGVWVGEGDGYADGYMVYDQWYCDQCCHHEENDDPDLLPNYCPNCGAKMSVPKDADE